MGKYSDMRQQHSKTKAEYSKTIPNLMSSLGNVTNALVDSQILDTKTMEMIFIGCAISRHCHPCMVSHVNSFIKAGGSREELIAVIAVAIAMGGGPDANYATTALEAYDELVQEDMA